MLKADDTRRMNDDDAVAAMENSAVHMQIRYGELLAGDKKLTLVTSREAMEYFRTLEEAAASGNAATKDVEQARDSLALHAGLMSGMQLLDHYQMPLLNAIRAYQREHPLPPPPMEITEEEAPDTPQKPLPEKVSVRQTILRSLPTPIERVPGPPEIEKRFAEQRRNLPQRESFPKHAVLAFQRSPELGALVGAIINHAHQFGVDKDAPDAALDAAKEAAARKLGITTDNPIITGMVRVALSEIDGSAPGLAAAMMPKPDSPSH